MEVSTRSRRPPPFPAPIRRKTQPTEEPPPVIVVGVNNVADLEFRRVQYVCLIRGA